MGHNIKIENGEASMFYYGNTPWRGLGTKLDRPATSAEAIEAAKLDWEVVKLPLIAVDPVSRRLVDVKKNFGVVPADKISKADCPVFGIVGESYTPVQTPKRLASSTALLGKVKRYTIRRGPLARGKESGYWQNSLRILLSPTRIMSKNILF